MFIKRLLTTLLLSAIFFTGFRWLPPPKPYLCTCPPGIICTMNPCQS